MRARSTPQLEAIGYDGAFSFEAKHDPFLPLALAAEHTQTLRLGTAIAIAFARNPMNLANLAWGMQLAQRRALLARARHAGAPAHRAPLLDAVVAARRAHARDRARACARSSLAWQNGERLDFRGEFYRHTLMIPAFDPGPNPFGPPPVFVGGFGPRMTEVAGEMADGFIAHPFKTRESLLRERCCPRSSAGSRRAGGSAPQLEVICATLVVTADERARASRAWSSAASKQLAFYGSTPAYRQTLDAHGWGDLHVELNRLSKAGRWDEMAGLIDDDVLEAIAVVGARREIAGKLRARLAGIADGVSLTHNRAPDPAHWADVVRGLKRVA